MVDLWKDDINSLIASGLSLQEAKLKVISKLGKDVDDKQQEGEEERKMAQKYGLGEK
jgi:hypothetical protein